MKKHSDVRVAKGDDHISLAKLAGKKIVDVQGRLSKEFGDPPAFNLYKVIFEDGSHAFAEGEHDFPYLTEIPGVTDEDLESVYKTDPDYDPCAEDDSEDDDDQE